MYTGEGSDMGSLLFAQFCCKNKTVLKIKPNQKKKKDIFHLPSYVSGKKKIKNIVINRHGCYKILCGSELKTI